MARLCTVRFLSAVRAVAARCKLPFALRPGLSQEDMMRTKKITRERKNKKKGQRHPALPSDTTSASSSAKAGTSLPTSMVERKSSSYRASGEEALE